MCSSIGCALENFLATLGMLRLKRRRDAKAAHISLVGGTRVFVRNKCEIEATVRLSASARNDSEEFLRETIAKGYFEKTF